MKNILICDDHPILRQALAASICNEWPDAEIEEAENYIQAIELCKKDYSVVLLDLKMPCGDPMESILQIMAQKPHMPIVIITGVENQELMEKLIDVGVAGFVSKAQAG